MPCCRATSWPRRARRRGLKVILTGEGGDELFAGYGRYRRAARHRLLGGRPMRALGTFDGLGVLRDATAAWRGAMVEAEAAARTPRRSRLQAAPGPPTAPTGCPTIC